MHNESKSVQGDKAVEVALKNKYRKYPDREDPRYFEEIILPGITPKFKFSKIEKYKVFTIGSCFARNIEEALSDIPNIVIPTLSFSVPKEEWPHRPNGVLNEYTPGSMSQRILYTCKQLSFGDEAIFEIKPGQFIDCLLVSTQYPVTRERALQRRKEIKELYLNLLDSDILIITLGYVEAFMYKNIWINRLPPIPIVRRESEHFRFYRLDVFKTFDLLKNAIEELFNHNPFIKIIITVSPVPIQATFTPYDCVVANSYSKSVLRTAAMHISEYFDNVDYFPSYEIITSMGLSAFCDDLIHVKSNVVQKITKYFYECYFH